MSIVIARETFHAVEHEITLFSRHAGELSPLPGLKFKLNVEMYRAAEGSLASYTVRDDNLLIGYANFVIQPHPHFKESIWAFQDAVYLAPEYRGKNIGMRLLKFAENDLRKQADVCLHTVDVNHPMLGDLLKLMGYRHIYSLFGKILR